MLHAASRTPNRRRVGALNAPQDAQKPQTSNGEERELLAAARVGTTAVVRLLTASADATAFCLGHGTGAYQRMGGAPAEDCPLGRSRLAVAATAPRRHQIGATAGPGALPGSVRNPDEDSEHPRFRIAVGDRVRFVGHVRRRDPVGNAATGPRGLLPRRELDCGASGG